jgi:hypothetical protein
VTLASKDLTPPSTIQEETRRLYSSSIDLPPSKLNHQQQKENPPQKPHRSQEPTSSVVVVPGDASTHGTSTARRRNLFLYQSSSVGELLSSSSTQMSNAMGTAGSSRGGSGSSGGSEGCARGPGGSGRSIVLDTALSAPFATEKHALQFDTLQKRSLEQQLLTNHIEKEQLEARLKKLEQNGFKTISSRAEKVWLENKIQSLSSEISKLKLTLR